MTTRIRLVSGDTRPPVVVSLKNANADAIDCSGATVRMYFRAEGGASILSTIVGTLLTGFVNTDGSLNTTYTVPGSGGRVSFDWPVGALDVPQGNYEGEVEITFPDSTVQTVYDLIKFKVRADF